MRALASVLAILASAPFPSIAQTEGRTVEQEIWVNPGIGPPASADPEQYIRSVTVAFLGVLEGVRAEFRNPTKQSGLSTLLVFRPTEFIKGKGHGNAPLKVWMKGGTYFEASEGRRPGRPAESARALRLGASYFVAVTLWKEPDPPFQERLWVPWDETIIHLDGAKIASIVPNSPWMNAVTTRGRDYLIEVGGSDRDVFLATLRYAALREW